MTGASGGGINGDFAEDFSAILSGGFDCVLGPAFFSNFAVAVASAIAAVGASGGAVARAAASAAAGVP